MFVPLGYTFIPEPPPQHNGVLIQGAGLGTLLKTNWQFWLGLGISVLLLLFLLRQVDLDKTRNALGQADYILAVPAIALYFVAVFFRAVRWRYLLSPLRLVPLGRLYPAVVIGYMANNLLPVRLGELVRAYYLARREQFSASSTLATVAVERVYDGVTLLSFAATAGLALLLLGEFTGSTNLSRSGIIALSVATVAIFLAGLLVLTLMATILQFVPFMDRRFGMVLGRFRPKVRSLAETFVQGLAILSSPRRHLGLFVLSVPVWLLEGGVYLLIGYSFGIDGFFGSIWVFILVVALVTATSNLATSIPSAIGGIGPFEVVALNTLLALGVDSSLAALYAVFVHLVALWLPVNLVGLALLWKQKASLRQLMQAPNAGEGDKEPEPAFASSLTRAKEDIS